MSSAQEEFNELVRDKTHRTTHQEDSSDEESDLQSRDPSPTHFELDDYEIYDEPARPSISSTRSATTIPTTSFRANTGPKGVITDARDFVDSRRVHRRQSAMLLAAQVESQKPSHTVNGQGTFSSKADEDEIEDLDDEYDEFLDVWRANRLQQLQDGARVLSPARSLDEGSRKFGSLLSVDGDGYLDAVDNSGKDTAVIVYIYDDYSDVSTALERCLRPLAAKHTDSRFVKMHCEEAAMEPAGVPALLAYRNGEKFAALVPLIDEMPDDADLTATTLEALLQRHQIIK